MPGKTNTEQIRELTITMAILDEQVKGLRRDVERIDKALEESERKRWQMMLAFLGSLLTFIVSLVALMFRR
ncbi:MAG: hypothetical protein L0215_18110 [Gemmataceae bacterium]|nr:hypothetical protein [Gemmataceae bacterium]